MSSIRENCVFIRGNLKYKTRRIQYIVHVALYNICEFGKIPMYSTGVVFIQSTLVRADTLGTVTLGSIIARVR